MGWIFNILPCYGLIPLGASFLGALPLFFGAPSWTCLVTVPLLTWLIYFSLGGRVDRRRGARINGISLLLLALCFTVLMVLGKGSVDSTAVGQLLWLTLPFCPLWLILSLMGERLILVLAIFLTYAAGYLFCTCRKGERPRWRRLVLPGVGLALCAALCTVLYCSRPEVRYGGHGFAYMSGFSSTDFSQYMVYSQPGRLAALDHPASFQIEDPADMPVMDGAEACYPLYAAAAKAVYQDIAAIEADWAHSGADTGANGKIVTFTNTVMGFDRLVRGDADLFFGARPSADQLAYAADLGVELEITPIGREAFVFFVEEDNPVDSLTRDQLRAIYHGDVTDWSQVGGTPGEIAAFQRPAGSGSQTMMEYFMGEVSLKEPLTYEMVDSMAGVIRHVAQYANEHGALGYSFRYFIEGLSQEQGVKLLAVDGVSPDLPHIEDGSYPLTVPLCLVTRKDAPNPNVKNMIDFFLSPDGQTLVRETGYGALAPREPRPEGE